MGFVGHWPMVGIMGRTTPVFPPRLTIRRLARRTSLLGPPPLATQCGCGMRQLTRYARAQLGAVSPYASAMTACTPSAEPSSNNGPRSHNLARGRRDQPDNAPPARIKAIRHPLPSGGAPTPSRAHLRRTLTKPTAKGSVEHQPAARIMVRTAPVLPPHLIIKAVSSEKSAPWTQRRSPCSAAARRIISPDMFRLLGRRASHARHGERARDDAAPRIEATPHPPPRGRQRRGCWGAPR
jgi:hypothetical protein